MALVLHASEYPARQGIYVAETPPFAPPPTPGSQEQLLQRTPLGNILTADLPVKPPEML